MLRSVVSAIFLGSFGLFNCSSKKCVVASATNRTPNEGISVTTTGPVASSPPTMRNGLVAIGDLDINGDGYADLAISAHSIYSQGQGDDLLAVFLGSLKGLASKPSVVYPGVSNAAHVGDFNGDGFSDLVVREPIGGQLQLWKGGPAGLQQNTNVVFADIPTGARVEPVGDINGDHLDDVIVIDDAHCDDTNESFPPSGKCSDHRPRLFHFHGTKNTGFLVAAQTVEYPHGKPERWRGVGDINHDGFADLATPDAVLFGGSGAFAQPVPLSAPQVGGSLGLLATQHGALSVIHNNPTEYTRSLTLQSLSSDLRNGPSISVKLPKMMLITWGPAPFAKTNPGDTEGMVLGSTNDVILIVNNTAQVLATPYLAKDNSVFGAVAAHFRGKDILDVVATTPCSCSTAHLDENVAGFIVLWTASNGGFTASTFRLDDPGHSRDPWIVAGQPITR